MKLALAIVLCSGLYLCAVSLQQTEPIITLPQFEVKYYGIIHFLKNDDPEFKWFSKYAGGYKKFVDIYKRRPEFLINYQGYEEFVKCEDPECQQFTKNYQGFKQFPNRNDPEYQEFLKNEDEISKMFPKTYQGFKNEKKYRIFHDDHHGYEEFLKIVDKKYEKLLDRAYSDWSSGYKEYMQGDYNMRSWENFENADLDFKLNCIEAFEAKFPRNPDNSENDSEEDDRCKHAYIVLQKQIGNLIEDLKNSLPTGNYIVKEMNDIMYEDSFLNFFGFWFAPDCNENVLLEEIEKKMKAKPGSSVKAARLMVIWTMYNHYSPEENP